MSQHIVTKRTKWVFGWDQPTMSFFLQVHNEDLSEEIPVICLPTLGKPIYEVEDLVTAARKTGLTIDPETQRKLYLEKDEGI